VNRLEKNAPAAASGLKTLMQPRHFEFLPTCAVTDLLGSCSRFSTGRESPVDFCLPVKARQPTTS